MNPFQELSLTGNLSIQIDFIFRNNPFQELSSTGNGSSTGICAAASDTKNLEVHLWRNHSRGKRKKTYKGCFLERTIALLMCLLQLYTTAQNEIFHNMRLRLLLPNYIIQG